jgi:acylphosphatase
MKQRVVIRLLGEVQGINLRSMVKVKALSLGLTGYVANQDDFTVKIEAEGEKDNLEELIRWLNTRPGAAKIEKLEDYWSDARNKFNDFVIKW